MPTIDIQALNAQVRADGAVVQRIRQETAKVIVGQQYMVDRLLIGLLSRGHILLEGLPGLAKTLAINTLSQTINAEFSRIQFTPDLLPADIVGTMIYNAKLNDFTVRKGPVFANFVLADEINRAPAKVQAALLEAMQERQVTIGEESFRLEEPFLVLATQNPIDQEGTYRLPEAQLDRFLVRLQIGYPELEDERAILERFRSDFDQRKGEEVTAVVGPEQIARFREQVEQVTIHDQLLHYIAGIVHRTRSHPDIYLGASPRASLALLRLSKAVAAMAGRDFVTPDDVKRVALPVLNHRIILTPEREMEGYTAETVVEEISERMEIPR